ncbi:hypothetical protein X797_007869 [Metarhizium robertsii]|uniref:Uncharacterized protein n=1 Tax=Metarhizium robertsii TaxID=568076 RepID=A0A0A1UT66_9HYPO|nr:hypothetical protein X797_007869 [Metarhizium robertsii]
MPTQSSHKLSSAPIRTPQSHAPDADGVHNLVDSRLDLRIVVIRIMMAETAVLPTGTCSFGHFTGGTGSHNAGRAQFSFLSCDDLLIGKNLEEDRALKSNVSSVTQ